MSPTELVREAGIPSATLSGLLNGQHRPGLETVWKLAQYFHQPLESLWAMVQPPERNESPRVSVVVGVSSAWLVPKISTEASAGGGALVPEGFEVVAPIRGASQNLVAVTVRGDCMSPRIESGDTVIVDLRRQWQNGSIVLARVGDELYIKRAYHENSHVRLRADADGYSDIVDRETQILGVIIKIEKMPI